MALSGVEPIPLAFLLVSMGNGAPGHLSACRRHLMGCAGWEAEVDRWRPGRLGRLVDLCLEDLRRDHTAKMSSATLAREFGVSESMWHRAWSARYRRIMRDALDQASRAHQQMARRVEG